MCSGVEHSSPLYVQQWSRVDFSPTCAAEQTTLVCCMCSSGAVCSAMLHGQQWSTLPFSVEQSEMSGAPLQKERSSTVNSAESAESTVLQCKWSGERSTPLQMEWREQCSTAKRAEIAEFCSKQSIECRQHSTPMEIEWRAQYSTAMEWRAQCLSTTCGAAEHHALH